MSEEQEQRLVEAIRGGDARAFDELLRHIEPRLYRFSMKMCRDPEDARDVLQDTALAMFRSIHGFRGDSSLSTWGYTIARSFCIKKRRRSKFAPEREISLDADPDDAQQIVDPRRRPDQLLESRRLEAALDRAVAALRPSQREVLLLRDIEGLSAAEVSEVLGIRVPAVKSRLHRARAAVRDQLAPTYGLPSGLSEQPGCPDIAARFSRYLEGEIRPSACAEMQRHVESCRPCREVCDSLKRTLGLCQSVPAPRVPPALQESIREQVRRLVESDPQLSLRGAARVGGSEKS